MVGFDTLVSLQLCVLHIDGEEQMDIPQRGRPFAPQFYSQRVSFRSSVLQNICKQSLQQSVLNPVVDLMNQNVQCVHIVGMYSSVSSVWILKLRSTIILRDKL